MKCLSSFFSASGSPSASPPPVSCSPSTGHRPGPRTRSLHALRFLLYSLLSFWRPCLLPSSPSQPRPGGQGLLRAPSVVSRWCHSAAGGTGGGAPEPPPRLVAEAAEPSLGPCSRLQSCHSGSSAGFGVRSASIPPLSQTRWLDCTGEARTAAQRRRHPQAVSTRGRGVH